MADDNLEISVDSTLNIEGKPNVPLCPLCAEILENAKSTYTYKRNNPDTRWFKCVQCNSHLGYHRMKAKWIVDPYDLDNNDTVRAYFGLGPAEEEE